MHGGPRARAATGGGDGHWTRGPDGRAGLADGGGDSAGARPSPAGAARADGVSRVLPTLAWALLGLLWGSTWLAIKVGLEDVPPLTFAASRFLVAVLPLLVILRLRRVRLPRRPRDWALMAVSGVLTIGLSYGLVFWGEVRITAGLTAILFATYPLFGLLFAHLLLPAEPLSAPRLLGVVAGIGGVGLIFSDQVGGAGGSAVAGGTAVVVAAACAAIGGVLVKGHGAHLDPMVVTAAQMICGLVPLFLAGVVAEGDPLAVHWTPLALGALAYLALVGSSLCLVIWYWLIRAVPVTTAQLVPLANTVVAVLLGWLFLGEVLDARTVLGGAAVLAGLGVALLRPAAARAAPRSALPRATSGETPGGPPGPPRTRRGRWRSAARPLRAWLRPRHGRRSP